MILLAKENQFENLNWSNGGLRDEPRTLVVLPFLRQPLYALGLAVNEAVSEQAELLTRFDLILTAVVDEVGAPGLAAEQQRVKSCKSLILLLY
jgi:hypothetical protein